jgi:hypothetical protein
MDTSVLIRAAAIAAVAVTVGSVPARATIVQYRFAGTVTGILAGGDTNGVVLNDSVAARVRYDPAMLVDVTAAANAAFGAGTYTKLQAAPLTGTGAGLTIDVGPLHFTAADQLPVPDILGAGGDPYVLFRDGSFFGVTFFGAKPWLAAFNTAGAAPEPFDFVGGSLKLGGPSYFGFFDYGSATFDGAVPESGSWALMIAGFGLVGGALRRLRLASPGGASA